MLLEIPCHFLFGAHLATALVAVRAWIGFSVWTESAITLECALHTPMLERFKHGRKTRFRMYTNHCLECLSFLKPIQFWMFGTIVGIVSLLMDDNSVDDSFLELTSMAILSWFGACLQAREGFCKQPVMCYAHLWGTSGNTPYSDVWKHTFTGSLWTYREISLSIYLYIYTGLYISTKRTQLEKAHVKKRYASQSTNHDKPLGEYWGRLTNQCQLGPSSCS